MSRPRFKESSFVNQASGGKKKKKHNQKHILIGKKSTFPIPLLPLTLLPLMHTQAGLTCNQKT